MAVCEIQGDAAFTAFQTKLASIVVNAPKLGKRVGFDSGCCCPLGAHPEAVTPFPPSRLARAGGWNEVAPLDLVGFINGFSGLHDPSSAEPAFSGPYAALGALHRKIAGR